MYYNDKKISINSLFANVDDLFEGKKEAPGPNKTEDQKKDKLQDLQVSDLENYPKEWITGKKLNRTSNKELRDIIRGKKPNLSDKKNASCEFNIEIQPATPKIQGGQSNESDNEFFNLGKAFKNAIVKSVKHNEVLEEIQNLSDADAHAYANFAFGMYDTLKKQGVEVNEIISYDKETREYKFGETVIQLERGVKNSNRLKEYAQMLKDLTKAENELPESILNYINGLIS